MSLKQHAITGADLSGVGVIGLPDIPGLSTTAMQAKFEETARSVIIPHFNAMVNETADELAARSTTADVQQMIDEQVLDIGAGDMARAMYDPNRQRRNIFAKATAQQLGMVTLSDTPSATSKVAAGVAATPAAVQTAMTAAATAQSAANEGKTAAAAAQTTANEGKTAAAAAQKTANEGKTAAAAAQTTANEGKTAAAAAQTTANGRMPIGGGSFTGAITVPATAGNANQVRNGQVLNSSWGSTGQNVHTIYYIRK